MSQPEDARFANMHFVHLRIFSPSILDISSSNGNVPSSWNSTTPPYIQERRQPTSSPSNSRHETEYLASTYS